jgi:hypothetical protein
MNKKHYIIIKQGVDVWNAWREQNPDVKPDLEGVDLENTNLEGANLADVNLFNANLANSNLFGADLVNASLDLTNLFNANLESSTLFKANLFHANLVEACLTNAILIGVRFEVSYLINTDFSDARIRGTRFSRVDLSEVKGLDKVEHNGPSYIDINTLYKSKGNIPEVFLRGCGVPDNLIEYLPSLTGKAIEYYSCFISYSSKDEAFAKRLYADLQNSGVRCWYAPEDLKIGDKIRPTIDNSIRIHDKLLIILSDSSVASEWVEHEVEHALDLERQRKKSVLFPLRLDEAVMQSQTGWAGSIKRSRHIGDFTQWKEHDAYQESFERLLRDLKTDDK